MTEPKKKNQRGLHYQALEGIVTANGFFTAAVFIGINGTVAPSPSIPRLCVPGDDILQNLFLFEVLSFSFYLVSSLIAQGMKLAIAALEAVDPDQTKYVHMMGLVELPPAGDITSDEEMADGQNREKKKLWWFRTMMMLSVALSVLGSFFLMLSMVDVIQLKFGLLSCGSTAAVGAVLIMALFGVAGLTVYLGAVVYSLRVY